MGDRIRTTHAGSLPRPAELTALHARRFAGEPIDVDEFVARSRQATIDVVRRQNEIGIDEINNGEVGRESFFTYVRHRMSGFSGQSHRPPMRDLVKYPHYLNYLQRTAIAGDSVSLLSPPQATGPIVYGDTAAIDAECAELAQALRAIGKASNEAFVPSPSPGTTLVAGVIDTTTNYVEHPDTVADRLVHIARAHDDPRRLMAGTDSGFETSAGFASVVDEIAWQKLASLVEGARRASRMLFGGH
jgi:5-methyltetrahydropteroyltriglutamate--homocysteine methyltransferase